MVGLLNRSIVALRMRAIKNSMGDLLASKRRRKPRLKFLGGAGLVALAAVSVAGAAVALIPSKTEPSVPVGVQSYYEAHTAVPTRTQLPVITVPSDRLAPGTKTVIFGDSWTAGLFMKPVELGYAYVAGANMRLDTEVLGGSGTGYLNPGQAGQGNYATRMAALPESDARLLIIQGSVNDFNQNGYLGPAFDKTVAVAKEKFPAAQIVILGPSTSSMPEPAALAGADNILAERARNAGLPYVSPYAERWITSQNFTKVIDPQNSHPSAEGHAYLASKLAESLERIKAR